MRRPFSRKFECFGRHFSLTVPVAHMFIIILSRFEAVVVLTPYYKVKHCYK